MSTTVVPSPQACELYVAMALRAEDDQLSLSSTLTLALDRVEQGRQSDVSQVGELVQHGWIGYAADGGWTILHQ